MTMSIKMVRSDGEEFWLGDGPDGRTTGWRLPMPDIEGFARVSISLATAANVLTDGSSLVSKRVDAEQRIVHARYLGADVEAARERAEAFFNPKHAFQMHVTALGKTRWCEGELDAFDMPFQHAHMPVDMTFSLLCLDPYWRDQYRNDRPFSDAVPMFGFPFVSYAEEDLGRDKDHPAGCIASVRTYDGANTVYNDGDVPCAWRALVRAKGVLVNPTITKDGKHVRMLTTMVKDDELVIDFEASPPRITLNGENVINKATRDSAFLNMDMQVGANRFEFSCDNDGSAALADVRILFNARHLGV